MSIRINDCQLEIDEYRGVIYVHGPEKTLLRICRLPKPIPDPTAGEMLDITHLYGAGWGKPFRSCKASIHPGTSSTGFPCVLPAEHTGEHSYGAEYDEHKRLHP